MWLPVESQSLDFPYVPCLVPAKALAMERGERPEMMTGCAREAPSPPCLVTLDVCILYFNMLKLSDAICELLSVGLANSTRPSVYILRGADWAEALLCSRLDGDKVQPSKAEDS